MAEQPEEGKHQKRGEEGIKPYLKYSGMAFQMIGAMVIAAYVGVKLDDYFETENPWFTLSLLLIAVVATMLLVIISLTKKK